MKSHCSVTTEGIPGEEEEDRVHVALRVPDTVQGRAQLGNVSAFVLFRWV